MNPKTKPVTALLASDLDGTLLPVGEDDTHPVAVDEFRRRLAGRSHLGLAYVTGRAPDDALATARRHSLPDPDALACDVGTCVLWPDGDGWRRDEDFNARAVAALEGVTPDDVFGAVGGGTGFRPQGPTHQSEVKISFRLPTGGDAHDELERVRSVISGRGWRLSLVSSRCVFTGVILLDVLPGGVDKAAAVHHIRKTLLLAADDVVYAGDSGNDLAPLTAGFRAIVVGNAAEGLADRSRSFAAAEGRPHGVHVSTRHHLHGVLEGARAFGTL